MLAPLFTFHSFLDRGTYGVDLTCPVYPCPVFGLTVLTVEYGPQMQLFPTEHKQLLSEAREHFQAWERQQREEQRKKDRQLALSRLHFPPMEEAEPTEELAHLGMSVAVMD